MGANILIVEDEEPLITLLRYNLEAEGYEVDAVARGDEADTRLRETAPDLVVLDWMLPGLSGIELCRRLRARPQTLSLPIIMLTARAEESERIVGLELGADDYLAKPFSPGELVARVRALLRRSHRDSASETLTTTFHYGPLIVDTDRHTITDDGRTVTLTAKEFLLLEYLMQHRGRVLSRDVLLTDVWGYRYTGGTRTVDVHVRRLREKLPFLADALVTVKQFGYKLADPAPAPAPSV